MSLEATLQETNELLRQLITIAQSGAQIQAVAGEAEAPKRRGRPPKVAESSSSSSPAPTTATRVITSPAGQQFTIPLDGALPAGWTEGAVNPAAPAPLALTAGQAEQALFGHVNAPAVAAQAPTAAPVAPAPVPTAAPASAPAAAPDVTFDDVIGAFTALNKSTAPGHGRDGVIAILSRYLPGDAKPSVPKLAALGKNAEILAAVQGVMAVVAQAAAPATEYDPLA